MSAISHKRVASLPKYVWLQDDCFARWLTSHLKPLGRTICDVGAGDGFMITYLGAAFSKVIAIEPNLSALRVLTKRFAGHRIRVLEGHAEAIPLPNKAVDIAFAKSSFHHFDCMGSGLKEMHRVAKKAIVVVEAVVPSHHALRFVEKILLKKEPGRKKESVCSEVILKSHIAKLSHDVRSLHFDQYIDVTAWLTYSDLDKNTKIKIYQCIAEQSGIIKNDMQIHFRNKRLVMLRRMVLVVGLLD